MAGDAPSSPERLSVKQAAAELGVSRHTVRDYRARGWLPPTGDFSREDIEAARAKRDGPKPPKKAGPLRGAAARKTPPTPAPSPPTPAPSPNAPAPALPRAPKLNLPCRSDSPNTRTPNTPPASPEPPGSPARGQGEGGGDFLPSGEDW